MKFGFTLPALRVAAYLHRYSPNDFPAGFIAPQPQAAPAE